MTVFLDFEDPEKNKQIPPGIHPIVHVCMLARVLSGSSEFKRDDCRPAYKKKLQKCSTQSQSFEGSYVDT